MTEEDKLVLTALSEARLGTSGWWRCECPFCEYRVGTADKHGAFGVRAANGVFHCFRCGIVGRLREVPDTHWREPKETDEPDAVIEPPGSFLPLAEEPAASALIARPAHQYLARRSVTRTTIAEVGIGFCPSGFYSDRIVVPVASVDGDAWVGWVSRAWVKCEQPYLYPKGMKRTILFNHAAILKESDDPILVVEGVFDALPYWPDAVACLGKPTQLQMVALASARRPVVMALDGDAWEEGWALAQQLRFAGTRAGNVRLPPCLDPNDVDPSWLRSEARACLN